LSQLLIQHYLNELQTLRRMSGASRESVVREAFKRLLKEWGKSRDLIFIPEYEYQTPQKARVYPDGAKGYSAAGASAEITRVLDALSLMLGGRCAAASRVAV
jgi:hypothetical protein